MKEKIVAGLKGNGVWGRRIIIDNMQEVSAVDGGAKQSGSGKDICEP